MADHSVPPVSDVVSGADHGSGITLQSRRARLAGIGLALGLTVTGTTVWRSPALRENVVGGMLEAAPLSRAVKNDLRAIAKVPPKDAKLQALVGGMSQALRTGDLRAARALSRQVLTALRQDPEAPKLLTRAGMSIEAVRRIASSVDTRSGVGRGSGDREAERSGTTMAADLHRRGSIGTVGRTRGRGGQPTVVPAVAKANKRPTHCWEFRFQQDAQAAYAADLQDPYGLDGKAGPRNDDGLACTHLPVDKSRPPSVPVWPFVGNAPPRPEIIKPAKVFFGVFADQAPFTFSEVNQLAARVEHTPNSVTWFSGWDQDFRTEAAAASWRRGMLPIVAWESRPNATDMSAYSRNSVNPDYQLSDIISGRYDDYVRRYARAVASFQLPVGLRFDHEMNGIWYPWAEQVNGNKPGEYIAAWRHVHDIFVAEGATNAIWIWAPNTVQFPQAQPLEQLYPGDDYVDWVGLTGYYRKLIPGKPGTFQNTYGKSLAALRAVAPGKPIFLTEVGATDSGGNKVAWINSFFEGMRNNPDIVGFTWFHTHVTAIPLGKKLPVTNDWSFTSTPAVAEAFRAGIRDARYGEGLPIQPKTPLPAATPSVEPTPSADTPSAQPTPTAAPPAVAPPAVAPPTAAPPTAAPQSAPPTPAASSAPPTPSLAGAPAAPTAPQTPEPSASPTSTESTPTTDSARTTESSPTDDPASDGEAPTK